MFDAWRTGWSRVASQKQIILIYYIVSFVLTLLALIPHMQLHSQFGGFSLMMQSGFDNFDYLTDILHHESIAFNNANSSLLVGLVFMLGVNLLLSAGVLSQFKAGKSYQSSVFWGGGFYYFGSFVRLGLWSFLYLAVLIVPLLLVLKLIELFIDDNPYQTWSFWLMCIKFSLIMIAFFIWRTLFAWSRIMLVADEEKSTYRVFIKVIRNIFRTKTLWIIACLNLGIGLLFLLAYISMKAVFGNSVITLLFAQFYLLARISVKLALFGGMWGLFATTQSAEFTDSPVAHGI